MTEISTSVSFGGEGTFDLLTNAYTPRFFYSHLDREIALANRAHAQTRIYPISLISFRLPLVQFPNSTGKGARKSSLQKSQQLLAAYEKSLMGLARSLEKTMREGDVLARLYESGLIISTRNDIFGVEAMKKRMEKSLSPEVQIFSIERKRAETRQSLIERIDVQYFSQVEVVDKKIRS